MDSTFNPYLKWLGIPLKDQPPHHYRLLGVEPLESDADIIQRAADRQMNYVRSLQNGEQASAAQQLLNELSTAKVCLLDEEKKSAYDRKLQVELQEKGLRPKPAPRMPSPDGSGIAAAAPAAASPTGAAPAVARPRAAKAPPPRRKPAASDSRIASSTGNGSSSSNGRKPAKPSAGAQRAVAAAPVIAVAPAAKPSPNRAAKPSPNKTAAAAGDAQADGKGEGSSLPLILGICGGVAALLIVAVALYALLSPDDAGKKDVARGANAGQSSGNGNSTSRGASGGVGKLPDVGNSGNSTNTNNSNSPNGSNSGGNSTTGGSRKQHKDAHLLIEAPFLVGTIAKGKPILTDRDYTFSQVDPALADLQFTRWDFGPVKNYQVSVERPGPVYMILPPEQYARPLPDVGVAGWKATDLSCRIKVEGGLVKDCLVLVREGAGKSLNIDAGPSIWPIVAAAIVEKKPHLLDSLVNGSTDGNVGNTVPHKGGNSTGHGGNTSGGNTSGGNTTGGNTGPTGGQATPSGGNTAKTVAKLKVPASAAQAPIRARIAEVFELSTLKTSEEKLDAAKRMLQVGREPSENGVERYVMLATSAQMAADAGDLLTALRAVADIAESYDAKSAAMGLHLVRQYAKSRVPKNQKLEQLKYVLPVLDQGLADDEYNAVEETVTALFSAGLSHKDLGDRRKIAREMQAKYRKVAQAKETLKTKPDDGAANTIAGQWICFQKMNWDAGLPMLAQSDDADLRKLAKSDLASPDGGKEQTAIADGWYKLADEQDSDQARGALLTRAEDWYRKSLTSVKGLDEAHARKRLDEIKTSLVELGWVDLPKKAVIAATAGYSCEIYLNGKEILDASYGVATANVTLKRGDLLMVHAEKSTSSYSSYNKGFACVIAFEGSDAPAITGQSENWKAFVPANTGFWYKPENIARTVPYAISPSAGHVELNQKTGVIARSLWYAAGNTSDAYFVYRVE